MRLPIEIPGKIVCVGLNYRDHAAEAGVEVPSAPILFAKWRSCLIGPGEPIEIPAGVTMCDWEGELGVVIGRQAKHVHADDALDVVRGYICLNDVTARDQARSDGQWTRGKSADTFGPIGPALVPASEIDDPQALAIRTTLNDTTVQDASTAQMVFSVREIIEHVTRSITLDPGDLIATGTPAGVGSGRRPPVFMQPGDRITVEIEGIGALSNPIVAAAAPSSA